MKAWMSMLLAIALCVANAWADGGHRGRVPAARIQSRHGQRLEPTNRVIAQFRHGTSDKQIAAILESFSIVTSIRTDPRHHGRVIVETSSPLDAANMADELAKNHKVLWAEQDLKGAPKAKYLPTDTRFPDQWYLHNIGQGGGLTNRDLCAEKAWDITAGTSTVVIAILDDGFDMTHPDLAANVFINPGEYGDGKESNGTDDDSDDYNDDWRGWDFVDNDNNPSPAETNDNHGTAMAGLAVAALDNGGEGIAALAGRCVFLPIRVSGATTANSAWAQAIEYAARFADVISISRYIPPTDIIYDALDYAIVNGRGGKGCVIFVALGNDGVFRRYSSDAAAAPEVISVSGNSNHDKRSWFADYGSPLDVVCPAGGGGDSGVTDLSRILTTDRMGAAGYATNNYTWRTGTSCASPLAAATAALMLSQQPELTGLEVRRLLELSCDRIDAIALPYNERAWNSQCGFGRVNAYAALTTQLPAEWDSYEPDDSPDQASPVEDGEIQYRSLSAGTDVDWARFTVTSGVEEVQLNVLGTMNAYLKLYNGSTNLIAVDNNGYPSYSYLIQTLTNDTYYVSVESPADQPIPRYGLHFAALNLTDSYEDDNSMSNAKPIPPREMQYRTLFPSGDVDWVVFTLSSTMQVYARTMGEWNGFLELSLWDTNSMIAYNYHTNQPTAFVSTQLAAGTYWIKANDISLMPVTSYQLILETFEPDSLENDNATNNATPIYPGQRVSRTLYPSNDIDWLTFTLTDKAGVLLMTDSINPILDPNEGDTELTLYRENNGELFFAGKNDDGNNWYFSALFKPGLDPGKYFVKVTGQDAAIVCPDYYVSLDVFENRTWFDNISLQTNGVELEWPGDSVFNYEIQYATNLAETNAWTAATNIEGRLGTNRWIDDGTATLPPDAAAPRFYRIVTR